MQAIFVPEPHRIEIREMPIPVPAAGQVLVRVRAAGICGSDVHIYHGTNPLARYPRIVGHEFGGEVVELGPDTEGPALGTRVAVDPVVSCGKCYACSVGRPNVCSGLEVFGVHRDGGFAEYVSVPAANAYEIPADWPWERASLVEPFTIAANVLSRVQCRGDDRVLVYGAGPIGLVILQAAKRLGAEVLITDIQESRLDLARSMGADRVVNSMKQSVREAVMEWTDGLGVPVVIDAVGLPGLFQEVLELACPAGRIGVLGFSKEPAPIQQFEVTRKELTIVGSRLNRNKFPEVIDWFAKEEVRPELLVSHRFHFTEVLEAMRLIEEKPHETCKVLLSFE